MSPFPHGPSPRERNVPLAPLGLFSIMASLHAGAAQADGGWPELYTPTASTAPQPGDVAVVVGIEDYDHLLDVPGAEAAARAWHRWFDQALGVPGDQLELLLGAEATAEAMASAVTEAALEVGAGARVWFVYIGQASPSCDGRDALLFASNAGPEAAGFYHGAFTWSSLEGLLDMGSHGSAVVLIDASINERDRSLDRLACELLPVMPPVSLVPSSRSVLLTAARSDEFAGSLYGTAQPAFASLMLGALRGWGDSDGDGAVRASEATAWIRTVLGATERRLPQNPQIWGDDSQAVLAMATLPSPALDAMLFEVARHATQARAPELGWAPQPVLAPEATALPPDTAAQASHDQLTGEMRHLGRRNAWKGVEQAFLDLEALAPQGVVPSEEDLSLGAQAARALGKVDAVVDRLARLQAIAPSTEGQQWLDEISRSYGAVSLRDRSGGGATLEVARMPLAPDQRACIDAAIAAVAESGRFDGLLPWGVYRFGQRSFMVVPGDPSVEIVLRRR